jgi:hypothetical protein
MYFLDFGLWKVCISQLREHPERSLDVVSQVHDSRVRGHCRSSPSYSYNTDSAGLVEGTGYQTNSWGGVVVEGTTETKSY